MAELMTQANRLLAVSTPAGDDVLLIDSFTGVEGISRPYRFALKMVAQLRDGDGSATGNENKVKSHDLVGQSMTIRIALSESGTGETSGERYITGFCERFIKEHQSDEFAHYSAVIVPWFSFLNYATNCRIFQDMDVIQIIQQVVNNYGYSDKLKLDLNKSYTPRDYCVQYRETDFAFVSRLMEAEGIFYYFEHADGDHKMVLADAPSSYHDLPEQSNFKYSAVAGLSATEDTIRTWQVEEKMHPGKWTVRDFHHEIPHNPVEVTETSVSVAEEGKKFEVYDFPGEYAKKFNKVDSSGKVRSEGERLDRIRMEKEESYHQVITGVSRCRAFSTGYKITVQGGDAAGSYLLTELEHRSNQQPAYGARDNTRLAYENGLRAIPASVPFIPPAVTGRPTVHGLQTAFVIDESQSGNTEEIWPDKYGRVRVRFHWDREAKYACWLRVVQPWAGQSWGQLWLPRTGDEVAVSFLEGDPDCPIIVGSVYNAQNMPIFTLPDNKTQSGILTHSSTGGGSSNFNMLRFEDKKGSEEIFMQAEKDWNSLIKHDETRTVKNNRTTTIHVNESRTVETGDDTIDVQQGKRTITVMGNVSETVKQGNISTTANQGNISVKADMGNISETASLGNITIEASVGKISISGLAGIQLSCGASTIQMTPASISISAPMVLINS
jgi:type VI secretion system secreted protein VgrG